MKMFRGFRDVVSLRHLGDIQGHAEDILRMFRRYRDPLHILGPSLEVRTVHNKFHVTRNVCSCYGLTIRFLL